MPEKYTLKKGEAISRGLSIVTMGVLGVALLVTTIMGLESDNMGTSVFLFVVALVMLGVAAYAVRTGMTPFEFVELTDNGINLNNRTQIPWDAIQSAEEEKFVRRRRYSTETKQRVRIRYADPVRNKTVDNTAVVSDYEDYPTLRDRILQKQAKA